MISVGVAAWSSQLFMLIYLIFLRAAVKYRDGRGAVAAKSRLLDKTIVSSLCILANFMAALVCA